MYAPVNLAIFTEMLYIEMCAALPAGRANRAQVAYASARRCLTVPVKRYLPVPVLHQDAYRTCLDS